MQIEFTEEIYACMKALGMYEGEIAFIFQTGVRNIENAKQDFDLFHIESRVDELRNNSSIAKKRLKRFTDTRGRKIGYRKNKVGGQ